MKILRTVCVLTQTLKPLPGTQKRINASVDEKFLTIQIHYYDSSTPLEYEPPLFRAAKEDEIQLDFDGFKPLKVELGMAETEHHK